jgi:uncharacterized repeat protein (TIGR01451 family)
MFSDWMTYLCSRLSGLMAGVPAVDRNGRRQVPGADAPGTAAGVRPLRYLASSAKLACAALFLAALSPYQAVSSTQGDKIVNSALFSSAGTLPVSSAVTVTVVERTKSVIEFYKYAPGASGAVNTHVPPTYFLEGASPTGPFRPMPPPRQAGNLKPIDLSIPVPLIPATLFHAEEPVFVKTTDLDQNLDRTRAESISVTITDPVTGDTELVLLTETGPDTGVFFGYFQTVSTPTTLNNGVLSVVNASTITARYVDIVDGSDTSVSAALIDPFGIVFNTLTGTPVDGATVELLDATTGKPATVLGDDGVSSYPATVTSGGIAADSSGRVYSFAPGTYRFPFIAPGSYRLRVTPPTGYTAPSSVATPRIQTLPGAPFVILEPGSRGEVFIVNAGPAIQIDIPLDPQIGTLWLKKSAGKTIVSAGDFVSYDVTVENTDQAGSVFSAVVADTLPTGFHYQRGSTRINGVPAADPPISADGRTMTFAVGTLLPKSTVSIRYVVGVGAGARAGVATNTATAASIPPVSANTAQASVQVQEAFLTGRSIIMGRVIVGACSDSAGDNKRGMEGVGIYLEDGTFVLSDKRGMFHFEGVRPGVHVLQLDLDSVPEGYRVIPCEQNSRFAGRAYSQFVDVQGGTMWRADFYLEKVVITPPVQEGLAEKGPGTMNGAPPSVTPEIPPMVAMSAPAPPVTYRGEVTLEMTSGRSGTVIDYRIPLRVHTVPLKNLKLTLSLPPGAAYQPGSSTFNGVVLPDPELTPEGLRYSLGEATDTWYRELQLRAVVDVKQTPGELETSAVLTFDTELADNIRAPKVANSIALTKEEKLEPLPLFVFHPHFPTFGAELGDADRRELDELVRRLSGKVIRRIDVAGHTDNVRIAPRSRGTYRDNTDLSFARARSVGRYLTAALQLPPEALYLNGSGEKEPVASNRTREGRALNRRVEVRVSALQRIESINLQMVRERSGLRKMETVGVLAGSAQPDTSAPTPPSLPEAAISMKISEHAIVPPAVALSRGVDPVAPETPGAGMAPAKTSPPVKEEQHEAHAELKVALNDGIFNYRLRLKRYAGPLKSARATVTLPKSLLYMNGTTLVNGLPVADPEANGSSLAYNLPELAAGKKFDLRFQAIMDGDDANAELRTAATVNVVDAAEPRTFTAETGVLESMEDLAEQEAPAPEAQEQVVQQPESSDDADSYHEPTGKVERQNPGAADRELHVSEDDGIISPTDGSLIATRINSVRVVLSSALKPLLLLDGKEIPAERIGFSMKDRESEKTLYTYIGIDFGDAGVHALQLKGLDPFGLARFDTTVSVARTGEITAIRLVSADGNLADGRTPVKVRVQLLDDSGKPVQANAELAIKEGNLKPLAAIGSQPGDAGGSTVMVSGDGWINFQPVSSSGPYRARLAYNKATLDIETYVKPKMRDWILVGLAEGTVGYSVASGHIENLRAAGQEEEFYDNGRLAFYAKGTIKGEWLLTMAYDSAKKSTGVAGNALFQTIDPNAFYTLYGDATAQQYDAASARKLYLRIERDQFYAMFGDIDTGLATTELSRYSRRLTGFKSEYRSQDVEVNVFGAETGQAFVKDELRGDGTSGLYRLSRRNVVLNSETITIQVRDRFHSELVLSTRTLSRFVDYAIDYDAGTLFFKEPVASKDETLNPVYIVVDYEIANSGADALTAGGRGVAKFRDGKLKVGASYAHEGQVSGEGNLYGLDADWQVTDATRVKAEIATSERDFGGGRRNGSAYLVEAAHRSKELETRAYVREQAGGFGLGQQMGSETATRKFGADAAYRLTDKVTVGGEAYRQYNLGTDAYRDYAEGRATYSEKSYSGRFGLRYAADHLGDGSIHSSTQMTVGGTWLTLDDRLVLRLDHEQSLWSQNANADFPTRTTLGVDFKATEKVTLFGQHEFTFGKDADASDSRVGIKVVPWQGAAVASSLGRQFNENGERVYSVVGLAQKWQVSEQWAVDGGLDRSYTIRNKPGYRFNLNVPPAAGANEDFTAVSLGANFRERRLAWSNRVEFRDGDTEDKWGFITGLVNEQDTVWGWTGRLQYLHAQSATSVRDDGELRLGLVYRPPVTRWIVLDRLDFLYSRQEAGGSVIEGRRIVNNINANYKPDKKTQYSVQYGAKYVLETIDSRDYSGYTDLIGLEGRHDITKKWDVGLRGSLLHAWSAGQLDFSLGTSVGYNVMENFWISLGYNAFGFTDRDFSAANYTAQGPFVQFRFKFDRNSVKEAVNWLGQ